MLRFGSPTLALALVLALPAMLPSVAHAQEKCLMPDGEMIGSIDNATFQAQLDAAKKALDEYQLDDARYLLHTLHDQMRCLVEPARPTDIVRFARLMALMSFFDQDEMGATKWGFMASDTVPDMPWPADMPPTHPLRNALSWAEEPGASGPVDKVVVYPKKGLILMNGHPLTIPQAGSDVPNLIQVFDKKGSLIEAYWQDGGSFKEEYLAEDDGKVPEPVVPKWYVGQDVKAAVEAMKKDPAYRVDEAVAMDDMEEDEDFDIDIDMDFAGSSPASEAPPAEAPADEAPPAEEPAPEEPVADATPDKEPAPEEPPAEEPAPEEPVADATPDEEPAPEEPPAEEPEPEEPVADATPDEEPPAEEPEPEEPVADATPDEEPAAEEPPAEESAAVVTTTEEPADDGVAEAPPPEEPAADLETLTTVPDEVAEDIATPVEEKIPKAPKEKKSSGGIKGGQLGVGVALGAVAGGMMGLAYLQEAKLADSTTEEELLTARARANQFVVGAGALGTVALGVSVTALIDAEGPGLALGWRW